MDKGLMRVYNRDSCVGSSIIERSPSSERCWCDSNPGAPFFVLDFYGVTAILLTHERAGDKKPRDTRRYKGQVGNWRDFIRPSQNRGRACYCRNKQEINRAGQEIWHETPTRFICCLNAIINQNKGVIWEG